MRAFGLSDPPRICDFLIVMRITTLNVQNLRLLETDGHGHLHGARDSDEPEDDTLDTIDRRLTAELLGDIDADVVALQEVFDLAALDHFHERYLVPAGASPYRERICLPGNDGRGLDVALLSRRRVDAIRSHAPLTLAEVGLDPPAGVDPELPVFRRDCLMATIGPLTLFVCHFKSPYPDAATAWTTRRLEALATRRLVERYFAESPDSLWLILGDLNEPGDDDGGRERAIAPLETNFAVDLMKRMPARDRWTYHDAHSGLYHCPDRLLASPALASRWPDAEPVVVRKGLGREASLFRGDRLAGTGRHRPHASDHAAVTIEFPRL
jgi:endonuclease/exonuclease/phosphatase family metal-dependent hydrolase